MKLATYQELLLKYDKLVDSPIDIFALQHMYRDEAYELVLRGQITANEYQFVEQTVFGLDLEIQ